MSNLATNLYSQLKDNQPPPTRHLPTPREFLAKVGHKVIYDGRFAPFIAESDKLLVALSLGDSLLYGDAINYLSPVLMNDWASLRSRIDVEIHQRQSEAVSARNSQQQRLINVVKSCRY